MCNPATALNNHIDVVILCCDWDSEPPYIVERDKYLFSVWNLITLSQSRCRTAGANCYRRNFWPLAAEEDAPSSAGSGRMYRYRQTDGGYFSTYLTFFQLISAAKDTIFHHFTGFGPVTWLCRLTHRIIISHIECLLSWSIFIEGSFLLSDYEEKDEIWMTYAHFSAFRGMYFIRAISDIFSPFVWVFFNALN